MTMKNREMRKLDILFLIVTALIVLAFVFSARSQTNQDPGPANSIVASGGPFMLEKAVVAGGGNQMVSGALLQSGTGGQAVAGTRSTGGAYSLYSGFWTPDDLAPTAAPASISGQVTSGEGVGIRDVIVTISDQSGLTRSTRTSTFGYFQFTDLEVGQGYFLTVHSTKYTFAQPTIFLTVVSDLTGVSFQASGQ
jgi:hypothetical protein